ncbi:hypothetical protein D3C80_1400720 [compost metagenome]
MLVDIQEYLLHRRCSAAILRNAFGRVLQKLQQPRLRLRGMPGLMDRAEVFIFAVIQGAGLIMELQQHADNLENAVAQEGLELGHSRVPAAGHRRYISA